MGNANPKALRLEHASKTGVLSLENMKLTKVPPEVAKKLDPKVNRRVVLMVGLRRILAGPDSNLCLAYFVSDISAVEHLI